MNPWWMGNSGRTALKPFLFAFLSKSVDIKNDALIKLRENEPRAI